MEPLPSIGAPSVSTTRPTIPSPTLIEAIRPVRFTVEPSFITLEAPKSTIPTLSSSRFNTIPSRPPSNCTSSPYSALVSPYARTIPSPTVNTVPTSSKEAVASKPESCSFKIADISAAFTSAILIYFILLIESQYSFS